MKNPFTGAFVGLDKFFQPQASPEQLITAHDVMAGAASSAWFKFSDPVDQARFRDVLQTALVSYNSENIAPGLCKSALHNAVAYVVRANGHNRDSVEPTVKALMHEVRRTLQETTLPERQTLVTGFLSVPAYTDKQYQNHQRTLDLMAGH
jgi:hypothetical protein